MLALMKELLVICFISVIGKSVDGLTMCTGIFANENCETSQCRINPAESVCLICNTSRHTKGMSWHTGNTKLARGGYNMDSNYAGGLVVNDCSSKKYSLKLQQPNTNHTNVSYICKQEERIISQFCLQLNDITEGPRFNTEMYTPNDTTSSTMTVSYMKDITEDSQMQRANMTKATCSEAAGAGNWMLLTLSVICTTGFIFIICGYGNKMRKYSSGSSKNTHRSELNDKEPNEATQECLVVMESNADPIDSVNGHNANISLKVTAVLKLKLSGAHEYWQGNYGDGCRSLEKCFIKTLSDEATFHEAKVFTSVATNIANLKKSTNVVRLLGLKRENGRCFMIYEYLDFGSLRDFVRTQFHHEKSKNEENSKLQIQQLLFFAYNIASAMEFIVSQNFSHPALSLKKVLLSTQCTCKLYDIYPSNMAMTKIKCAIKKSHTRIAWMSPETIFLSTYSSSSDVWSFSVLLWELFSLGETPYAGSSYEDIERNIRMDVNLPQPLVCPGAVYEVMLHSWITSDKARPSFRAIKQELEKIIRNK